MRCLEGVGTQQISQDFGLSRAAVDSHRTSGHPARALTKAIIAAGSGDGPLSELHQHFISRKSNRIKRLDQLCAKLETLMEQRGKDYAHLPGGSTGLVCLKKRMLGTGPTAYEVDEAIFDAAIVAEYRATLESAAKEMGEWRPQGSGSEKDGKDAGVSINITHAPSPVHKPVTLDYAPGRRPQAPKQTIQHPAGLIRQLTDLQQQAGRVTIDAALASDSDKSGKL